MQVIKKWWLILFCLQAEMKLYEFVEHLNSDGVKLYLKDMTPCMAHRNADVINLTTTLVRNPDESVDMISHTNLSRAIGPLSVRIKLTLKTNGRSKKIIDYSIKNLCKHYLTKPLIKSSWHLTPECYLEQGNYVTEVKQFDKVLSMLEGNFFTVGEYIARLVVSAGNVVALCNDLFYEVTKK